MMSSSEDDSGHYPYYTYVHDVSDRDPPLTTTESRILHCVVNNRVKELKSLINYPNLFKILDKWGNSLLQISIFNDNITVFDLLLSLDDCPLETRNYQGKTALEIALTGQRNDDIYNGEYFALSLLKKGAKIDYVTRLEGNSLLHWALEMGYFEVALFLIEKGADLNYQNDDGDTPIQWYGSSRNKEETLAMMLYFGADPSIPNFEGFRLVDYVLSDYYLPTPTKETFLFYVFDEYNTDYDIPIDTLFYLLIEESPLFPQVLKHITSVNVDKTWKGEDIHFFFGKLFEIKSEYLKLLLEKFEYVIDEIVNASLIKDEFSHHYYYTPLNEMFIQNFDLLLQSRFSSAVIQIFNRAQICEFIEKSQNSDVPQEELFESIMFLLSYGVNICDKDLELVYQIYGDCEYFRILLHMDIEITDKNQQCDKIMPTLLYDIHFDIETFLDHCSKPSPKALIELLNYFAHPKLKDFCSSLENGVIDAKVKNLPSIPLLVELARNEVRKFLIQKYKIANSMQFYTLIKHLPISKIHEKIITFETKLY